MISELRCELEQPQDKPFKNLEQMMNITCDEESMNMKSIKLGSIRSRRPSNHTEYDLPMGHDKI